MIETVPFRGLVPITGYQSCLATVWKASSRDPLYLFQEATKCAYPDPQLPPKICKHPKIIDINAKIEGNSLRVKVHIREKQQTNKLFKQTKTQQKTLISMYLERGQRRSSCSRKPFLICAQKYLESSMFSFQMQHAALWSRLRLRSSSSWNRLLIVNHLWDGQQSIMWSN